MSKPAKLLAGIVLAIMAGVYIASPYITLHRMQAALAAKDPQALSEYIDFPALKESIKGSISAAMMEEAGKPENNNAFAQAGAGLALAFIGPMVDRMVTPEGVAMMLQGEMSFPGSPGSGEASASGPAPEVSTSYEGLNTFALTLHDARSPDKTLKFIFLRHGLGSWKLSRAELPL